MNSKQYSQLNDELQVMDAYLNANPKKPTELGITKAQMQQFQDYCTDFHNDMKIYINPDQRTNTITKKIQADYKTIHAWISHLRTGIKTSKRDTLTEQDYISMFIHQDKPHSKHTKPDTTPTLELNHIEHLNARISAHHSSEFDKGTRPSLPESIDNIQWQWSLSDTKDISTDNHQKITTSATLKLQFTPEQAAKYCHITARYGITNGKVGAFSQPLVFVIT